MPYNFASGTAGILSSWELNRITAAMQGTYGWSVQSGAVTFSSGLIFNVAAVAAGDYTVNSTSGALYAGGTVTLTAADPTNPRIDIVVITAAGAVAAVPGTPAALTTTTGPVPPTPSATQLEIARIFVPANNTPAMSATSITDHRMPLVTRGMFLRGSSVAATSTTSTSAVDLVTISSLNIPVSSWIMVRVTFRKQALAAQPVAFGLKLNATVVVEASNTAYKPRSSGNSAAEAGYFTLLIPPRETANYGFGVEIDYQCWTTAGVTAASTVADIVAASGIGYMNAVPPQAAITAVAIRAINATTSNAAEVTTVDVYEWVAS